MIARPVGGRLIVDGARRPIREDAQGQYVLDDDGERIYGLRLVPEPECCDPPLIVEQVRHATLRQPT